MVEEHERDLELDRTVDRALYAIRRSQELIEQTEKLLEHTKALRNSQYFTPPNGKRIARRSRFRHEG
jgi:hypothetical protein